MAGAFRAAGGGRGAQRPDRPVPDGEPQGGRQGRRRAGRPDPDLARPRRPRRRRGPIARRTGATVASNYEISLWLQQPPQGLEGSKVQGLQHGGSFLFDGSIRVKLTLAFHGSALPDGSNGGNPCGFVLTFPDGIKIYDAADTALFGDMALIGEEGIDLAMLPIGDYYTMGPDDAVRAVKLIKPRFVLPIHYNTFPPITQDVDAWAARIKAETSAEPVVLQPGDWFEIPKK